ncbi:Rad2 nuclease [Podila horticola]|nr:Rad2 nuclease [Podila horticola]
MGIQGLLPLVKSIEKRVHLKDYAGMTLAVDGYVWLHKGAFACAQEICLGQPTQKYVTYFMRQIEMFKFFGVKPYVVFDGGYLPSKAATEDDRLSRREESKRQAMELLKSGKSKEALEQFRRCVDVTPEMAHAVIQALEVSQIDFVVAPYEADAQLAYLEMHGIVDGIVTEDSDLLVFGCKREVSFHDWSMTEIRHMCILAGCDYLPSIPGMGLKTAQRLLRKLKTFDKVIRYVRMESTSMKVQADYEESFRRADLTFLYARVYDPNTKCMVHLNPVPDELQAFVDTDEYNFLGPLLDQQTVHGIATGKLNPISKEPLVKAKAIAGQGHNHKPQFKFSGKENKAPKAPPTTKEISSFFTKKPASQPTKPPPTVPIPTTTTIWPSTAKREPFSGVEPVMSKENTPEPKDLIAHQPGVVVVSRSRFFGFESEKEPEAEEEPRLAKTSYSTTKHRSTTIREDSGIGLEDGDEDSKTPCPSLSLDMTLSPGYQSEASSPSGFESSQQSACSQEEHSQETSSQAERVIQGWREKFSNTSGSSSDTRPVGLTRAVQTSSKVQRSFTIKSTTSNDSVFSKPSFTKTSSVVRTTPGHPTYCMDAPVKTRAVRPSQTSFVGLSNKRAAASTPVYPPRPAPGPPRPKSNVSADVEEASSPILNLDRFKYTPSST